MNIQLLDISEPKFETFNEVAFGIDLGTTNSLIAFIENSGNIKVCTDSNGQELIPSVVSYSGNTISVGNDVDKNNTSAIRSVKRLMGKTKYDIKKTSTLFHNIANSETNDIHLNKEDNQTVTPVQVSAEILKKLCQIAKSNTGLDVKKAVITVPAYFNESERRATKDAAEIAGIEVLRLLNEPTAAALAYGFEKSENQGIYIMYDLGGGTFDISVLKLHEGLFQVLAVSGDTLLGGDDFDKKISEFVINKYKKTKKIFDIQLSHQEFNNIISIANQIKKELSKNFTTHFTFTINNDSFCCTIDRSEFNNMIFELVNKTISITLDTIKQAKISHKDISKVILVGGATKVPLIKSELEKIFDKKVFCDIDPEKVVVMGAALQAHYLSSTKSANKKLLIDVLPLSLGIETLGGIVEKIIPRNTPLPAKEIQEFTTYVDGQNAIQIHIYQGEREMVHDNKLLAKFDLKGIPPLPAGKARIKVEFTVDIDGLLTVTAREETTGLAQTVEINPHYGLTKDKVKEKVVESVENFDKDMESRQLAEEKIKGQHIIEVLRHSIIQDKNLLIDSEELLITNAINDAENALSNCNIEKIKQAILNIEHVSEKFIERRMKFYFQKSIEQV